MNDIEDRDITVLNSRRVSNWLQLKNELLRFIYYNMDSNSNIGVADTCSVDNLSVGVRVRFYHKGVKNYSGKLDFCGSVIEISPVSYCAEAEYAHAILCRCDTISLEVI